MSLARVVTLGGPPGSGKSTAARRVAATLGLELVSAGDRFRAEAAGRGLSLEAFGDYAARHPEVDRALDAAMAALAAPGRLLEGRIQGALLRRAGTPVHAVAVTAEEAERARRVAGRDGLDVAEALRRIRAREAVERARYRAFYGIDLDDVPADLTVDASRLDPSEVEHRIVAFLAAAERRP